MRSLIKSSNTFGVVALAAMVFLPACSEDNPPTTIAGAGGGLQPATGGIPGTGAVAGVGGTGAVAGVGGAGATTGTGATGSGATTGTGATTGAGGGVATEGVPLTWADGWIAADANTLGVQGAVFSYADLHTEVAMVETIVGATACISGEAFQVDLDCEITDPNASDCYGEFWGAAIGFNLHQDTVVVTDPDTGEEVEEGSDPLPFDASSISAFSFDLSGTTVPASMRFTVETQDGEFCTPKSVSVLAGANTIALADLVTECWAATGVPLADKTTVLKIAWQVVTNSSSTVPFDFCVGNLVAVP